MAVELCAGDSKGYGFVEYVTKEAALQAKNALDGKQILDTMAVCDWLDSSHVTLRSLHSKCLYVDRLPPNYRDMGEFRRIFSAVVNPPYCQVMHHPTIHFPHSSPIVIQDFQTHSISKRLVVTAVVVVAEARQLRKRVPDESLLVVGKLCPGESLPRCFLDCKKRFKFLKKTSSSM